MKKYREYGKYLVVDPQVCFGKLTFKGTRLMVERVLDSLAVGDTLDDIVKDWPYLPREAVEEAIRLASSALVEATGASPTYSSGLKPRPPWAKRPRAAKNGKRAMKSAL